MSMNTLLKFIEDDCPNAYVSIELTRLARAISQYQTKFSNVLTGGNQVAIQPQYSVLHVLVDGEHCLHRFYGGYFSDWVSGGQWNRMRQYVYSLAEACRNSGIEMVVAFNGSIEAKRKFVWSEKYQELGVRSGAVLRHIRSKGTPPPKLLWIPPPCIIRALCHALAEVNIPVIMTTSEYHQQELATIYREQGFDGLVAEDGEYAAFFPPRLFSANMFKLTYKGNMETKEYIMDEVAKQLNLNPSRFPMLASLLGNFLLCNADLQKFYTDVLHITDVNKAEPKDIISKVSEFVRNIDAVKIDDLSAIGELVFEGYSDKEYYKKKLTECVTYFKGGFIYGRVIPNSNRSRALGVATGYMNYVTDGNGLVIPVSSSGDGHSYNQMAGMFNTMSLQANSPSPHHPQHVQYPHHHHQHQAHSITPYHHQSYHEHQQQMQQYNAMISQNMMSHQYQQQHYSRMTNLPPHLHHQHGDALDHHQQSNYLQPYHTSFYDAHQQHHAQEHKQEVNIGDHLSFDREQSNQYATNPQQNQISVDSSKAHKNMYQPDPLTHQPHHPHSQPHPQQHHPHPGQHHPHPGQHHPHTGQHHPHTGQHHPHTGQHQPHEQPPRESHSQLHSNTSQLPDIQQQQTLPNVQYSEQEQEVIKLPPVPQGVLKEAHNRVKLGLMSPWVYQIINLGEIKLSVGLEDYEFRDNPLVSTISSLVYREVRQNCYAILFNLHHHIFLAKQHRMKLREDLKLRNASVKVVEEIKESPNMTPPDVPEIYIKEWSFTQFNKYQQYQLVAAIPLTWTAPTIQRLWFGTQEDMKEKRMNVLLSCFKSYTPAFLDREYIKEEHLILAIVLRYLLQCSRILKSIELDAFLAMAVDEKLNDVKYTESLQVPKLTVRGVLISNLVMRGIEHLFFVNDVCGSPLHSNVCGPWNYFDGKLFQTILDQLIEGKTLDQLLETKDLEIVKKIKQSIEENIVDVDKYYLPLVPTALPNHPLAAGAMGGNNSLPHGMYAPYGPSPQHPMYGYAHPSTCMIRGISYQYLPPNYNMMPYHQPPLYPYGPLNAPAFPGTSGVRPIPKNSSRGGKLSVGGQVVSQWASNMPPGMAHNAYPSLEMDFPASANSNYGAQRYGAKGMHGLNKNYHTEMKHNESASNENCVGVGRGKIITVQSANTKLNCDVENKVSMGVEPEKPPAQNVKASMKDANTTTEEFTNTSTTTQESREAATGKQPEEEHIGSTSSSEAGASGNVIDSSIHEDSVIPIDQPASASNCESSADDRCSKGSQTAEVESDNNNCDTGNECAIVNNIENIKDLPQTPDSEKCDEITTNSEVLATTDNTDDAGLLKHTKEDNGRSDERYKNIDEESNFDLDLLNGPNNKCDDMKIDTSQMVTEL